MSMDLAESMLSRRGVSVSSIADIVLKLQQRYHPKLTIEQCEESVRAVLGKREVQYTLYTGIALDELAEKKSPRSRRNRLWSKTNRFTEWMRPWRSALRAFTA